MFPLGNFPTTDSTLLLIYKSPLLFELEVEPNLSIPLQNSMTVAPLNKVFLTISNSVMSYFFFNSLHISQNLSILTGKTDAFLIPGAVERPLLGFGFW